MIRLVFLLTLFSALNVFAADPPQEFRFKTEVLVDNLPQPMQLQRAPDERIFFIEIKGLVKIYDPAAKKVVEAGKLEVMSEQENGLLGMALDPGFAKNQWIYLLHSPTNFDGQFISRFTMKGDQIDMASRKDLLSYPEQRKQCCHHAGGLRFGPDGCLYASSGDNTNPFDSDGFTPIDTRKDRDPWDAQKSSANTNDLRGKIIRIKPKSDGTYEIPPGNLFKPGTPNTRPEIFAMGFRNPWRFNIDQKTGVLYVGDVGPDAGQNKDDRGPNGFDTINQIKTAGFYGWPYSRGKQEYMAYDFEKKSTGTKFDAAKPINASPNNTGLKELPPVQQPLIWYPNGDSKEFPTLGSGGRTACAGPVFHFNPAFKNTGGFPEAYDGCLLFYDWQRPYVKWAKLDKDGKLAGIDPFLGAEIGQGPDNPNGKLKIRRPADMVFGTDGVLYVLDYGETWGANRDARLVKISYQWGNLAPFAKARPKSAQGREPLTVDLTAEGSKDPEGEPVTYEWRLLPDGNVFSKEEKPKLTIDKIGEYKAELRVTDPKGVSTSAFVPIVVGNAPPVVKFESPKEGDFFIPGKPVKFQIAVEDQEDGLSSAKPDEFGLRTLVSATRKLVDGHKEAIAPGLALMKQSDCFNCHAVGQLVVGPAFLEVAKKYRGQPGAEAATVERIIKGSTGIWGQVGMLPHANLTQDEVHIMVRWIFGLEETAAFPGMTRGVAGEIMAPVDSLAGCVIEATYADAGRPPVSSLSSKASVTLRSRRIEAEAGHPNGPGGYDSNKASGKRSLGGINHGHSVKFPGVKMGDPESITVSVSSGTEGGKIEVRSGKIDGPVVATFDVKGTGGWDNWQELSTPLSGAIPDNSEVFLVFLNEGKSSLLNLDWVQFE